jgi:hypothetical protein
MRKLDTRYGHLSRGRCWGKWFAGRSTPTGDFEWVEKDGGTLYVPEGEGLLLYGSSDGFRRAEKLKKFFPAEEVRS